MRCKIRGQNLRVMSKAVRVISKIADSVIITTTNNGIKLQAVNDSKTAFIEIDLNANFFDAYDNAVAAKCKLFIKSLILVFRLVNIDKYVDECTIIMDNTMPSIAFQMICFKDVKRDYFLPYMDCECLRYSSTLTNESVPAFISYSKVLAEALQFFSAITKDITIKVLQDRIKFRTHLEEDEHLDPMMPNTSFEYSSNEFYNYRFTEPKTLSFNLRDLKAFLELTSHQNLMVNTFIESSGRPITLTAENAAQNYQVKLILATFDDPCAIDDSQTGEHVSRNSFELETSEINSNRQTNSNTNINNGNNIDSNQINSNASNQDNVAHSQSILSHPQPSTSTNHSNDRFINRSNLFVNSYPKEMSYRNISNNNDDEYEEEDEWNQLLDGILDSNESERDKVNRLTASQLAKYQNFFLFGPDGYDQDNSPSTQDIIVPASDDEDSR